MTLQAKDANGNDIALTQLQLTQLQTDLGLGTAALVDTSTFATAAQGAKADSSILVNATTGLVDDAFQRSAIGSAAKYVRGLYNFKYTNTRQAVGAYLFAITGTGRGRCVVAMDSNGAGTGSLNSDTTNARSKSWGVLLANIIKGKGGNAYSSWAIGSGLSGATLSTYMAYDPRVVFGSSVTFNSTIISCGGQSWDTGTDTTNGYVDVTPI
jgi:hypothetical protein